MKCFTRFRRQIKTNEYYDQYFKINPITARIRIEKNYFDMWFQRGTHPTIKRKEDVYEKGFFLNTDLLAEHLADVV